MEYKLKELLYDDAYKMVEKYNLVSPIEAMINSNSSMIHIDAQDIKILNHHEITAYYNGIVKNINDIKLNIVDNDSKNGVVYIKTGFNFSLNDAKLCIDNVNKALNKEISVIYGVDITSSSNLYDVLILVTK